MPAQVKRRFEKTLLLEVINFARDNFELSADGRAVVDFQALAEFIKAITGDKEVYWFTDVQLRALWRAAQEHSLGTYDFDNVYEYLGGGR
jgi:phage-related protein